MREDNSDLKRGFSASPGFWFAIRGKMRKKPRGELNQIAPPLLNNIRNFVCSASVLLAVWLGATFVNKVPSHRYPSLGKGPVSTASITESSAAKIANVANAVDSGKGRLATVPVSR